MVGSPLGSLGKIDCPECNAKEWLIHQLIARGVGQVGSTIGAQFGGINPGARAGFGVLGGAVAREFVGDPLADRVILGMREPKKKKRKPSAYNRKYSKEFKRLKRKHPKMKFGTLAKKAHAACRPKRKKKGGKR